ncbi:hypothetical protein [Butyrivibrio sp. AE2032]|uniref:hypothetical protein n=1 Tax=Butyrivibrio sp. AE2032 TaxID=1458463 RepID=UPI00055024E8|nr:hypothetical protein [Butyrivibrio sp. AE2032]
MRLRKTDFLYLGAFAIVIAILVFRCFYGIGLSFSDEFSQPAVVKRFLQGDRVLIDDWQPATTLLGFFMSKIVGIFPAGGISLLGMRIAYVIFQVLVSCILLVVLGWKDPTTRIIAIAYLLSTPYGIMSICYNTVAIAGFLIFLALTFGNESRNLKRNSFLAGVALAFSVVAIPHVAIIFVLYCLVSIVLAFLHKENAFFSVRKLIWICLGIMVLFVPFCISVLMNGTIPEYVTNLHYIFSDPEHNAGIVSKLFASVYRVIRVYWRAWLPLIVLDGVLIIFRKKNISLQLIYGILCAIIIYATIRFAFIYGSISINLMLVPMFFYGLQAIFILLYIKESLRPYYRELLWLFAGYLFATCDYLATNTEILSMSAMFIVSAMASISLNIKLVHHCLEGSKAAKISVYSTIAVFILSQFVLRMTFIWGDASVAELNKRIEIGLARGIYTTEENVREYNMVQDIIQEAGLQDSDKVLFVPANPMYYLMSDAEIASPYVIRFKTSVEELGYYYSVHDYKFPTKVVIIKGKEDELLEEEAVDYFTSLDYQCNISEEDYIILEHR